MSQIIGLKNDPSFLEYYEISATRDLIVHNDLYVNRLYLEKSGSKARGKLGSRLVVDKKYYYNSLANLKKVSGAIKRDIEQKYGSRNK